MSTSEEDTDEPCHVSPKSSEFIPGLFYCIASAILLD